MKQHRPPPERRISLSRGASLTLTPEPDTGTPLVLVEWSGAAPIDDAFGRPDPLAYLTPAGARSIVRALSDWLLWLDGPSVAVTVTDIA